MKQGTARTGCPGLSLALVLVSCASGNVDPVAADGASPPAGEQGSSGVCLACADDDPCTSDLCLPGGGCSHEPSPGAPCDDGNACTVGDQCDGAGQCAGQDVAQPVYRFVNASLGSLYYSRVQESPPNGYVFEKQLFRIMPAGTPNTIPIYRLLSTDVAEFMLSRSPNEAADCCGYKDNGLIGHIFPQEQPNTVALHRLKKNTPVFRHLSTLDASEGTAEGFVYEYSPGFVCQ